MSSLFTTTLTLNSSQVEDLDRFEMAYLRVHCLSIILVMRLFIFHGSASGVGTPSRTKGFQPFYDSIPKVFHQVQQWNQDLIVEPTRTGRVTKEKFRSLQIKQGKI